VKVFVSLAGTLNSQNAVFFAVCRSKIILLLIFRVSASFTGEEREYFKFGFG